MKRYSAIFKCECGCGAIWSPSIYESNDGEKHTTGSRICDSVCCVRCLAENRHSASMWIDTTIVHVYTR